MTWPNEREGDSERDERDNARRVASDDLSAYALDALDPADRAAVERALADSPDLRDEADSFAASAAQLAELAQPVAPPADLRARLMGAIDAAPQVSRDVPVGGASKVPDLTDGTDAPGRAQAEARRRWFQRPGSLVAVAAAAVVLLVGAVIGIGWPGPNGWGAQIQMTAIAEAPDAQSTTLEAEGGGEITLVTSASKGRSAVVAAGLPELGDDQTYELWYIDDASAAPAGTFDMRGGETWRILDGSFTPGVAVGVTVEPAGGSPQPTSEPIVVITT